MASLLFPYFQCNFQAIKSARFLAKLLPPQAQSAYSASGKSRALKTERTCYGILGNNKQRLAGIRSVYLARWGRDPDPQLYRLLFSALAQTRPAEATGLIRLRLLLSHLFCALSWTLDSQ